MQATTFGNQFRYFFFLITLLTAFICFAPMTA